MRDKKLYEELAGSIGAYHRCKAKPTEFTEWVVKHKQNAEELTEEMMPSGSGIDCGTKLDVEASSDEKLVFHFEFHHMGESGMYDGWTDHTLTVTPSLQFGIRLKISGRDRNQIKEYLYETFEDALMQEIEREQAQSA